MIVAKWLAQDHTSIGAYKNWHLFQFGYYSVFLVEKCWKIYTRKIKWGYHFHLIREPDKFISSTNPLMDF